MWGKILTSDSLRIRGFTMWIGVVCVDVMARVDHLMIYCEEAYQLWCFFFRSFGVSWVLPRRVIDLLFGWRNWLGSTCLAFGIWHRCVWCGAFGGSVIIAHLRMRRVRGISFLPHLFSLCLIGLGLGTHIWWFPSNVIDSLLPYT